MSLLPGSGFNEDMGDGPLFSYRYQSAKYRRIATDAAQALPAAPVSEAVTPTWRLSIRFDANDAAATIEAVKNLAEAVREKQPRAYFQLEPSRIAEHAYVVTAKDRSVAIAHFFDVQLRHMITELGVAGS